MIARRARAKLFRNGGSQAVRLPKDCRFPDDEREVLVHRDGRRIILEPADDWPAEFRAALGAWHEPIERPTAEVRDPFDRSVRTKALKAASNGPKGSKSHKS